MKSQGLKEMLDSFIFKKNNKNTAKISKIS